MYVTLQLAHFWLASKTLPAPSPRLFKHSGFNLTKNTRKACDAALSFGTEGPYCVNSPPPPTLELEAPAPLNVLNIEFFGSVPVYFYPLIKMS